MIKYIGTQLDVASTDRIISFVINSESFLNVHLSDLVYAIEEKLVEQYVVEFGPEILKRIQEKTIEAKVIQKVVERLKKEIKEETK